MKFKPGCLLMNFTVQCGRKTTDVGYCINKSEIYGDYITDHYGAESRILNMGWILYAPDPLKKQGVWICPECVRSSEGETYPI